MDSDVEIVDSAAAINSKKRKGVDIDRLKAKALKRFIQPDEDDKNQLYAKIYHDLSVGEKLLIDIANDYPFEIPDNEEFDSQQEYECLCAMDRMYHSLGKM